VSVFQSPRSAHSNVGQEATTGRNIERRKPGKDNLAKRHPQIIVNKHQLRDLIGKGMDVLKKANEPAELFVRGGRLVRLRADEIGSPLIEDMSENALRSSLSRAANFYRRIGDQNITTFPPAALVKGILAEASWPFEGVQGVVQIPIFRKDGTVASKPGYDASSQSYYWDNATLIVPHIESHPSRLLSFA
jgi:hypothetical protein